MSAVLPLDAFGEVPASHSLASLRVGASARIVSVAASGADISAEMVRRLVDLGFRAGETVRVIARGPMGGEPVAVRIGTATFALRRQEAACIGIVA